jgi:hypothetical protein
MLGILWCGWSAMLLAVQPLPAQEPAQGLPRSHLAVEVEGRWKQWWRSERAPTRWRAAHPAIERAVRWRAVETGIERAEIRLAGHGEAWRLRVVLVRVDPRQVGFRLVQESRSNGTLGAWAVDRAGAGAVVALNAGQFADAAPWGWLVRQTIEVQPPGHGPLSMALVVDFAGSARLVPADSIEIVRRDSHVVWAFQSYPMLLVQDGVVPPPLREPGRGVDLAHRDSRLALAELRDGRLLIALTRFEGLGGVLDRLPFGPTTPELAALMGALGARKAVALDGGLSAQLLVREQGRAHTWAGMRRVPLGLEILADRNR